MRTYDRVQHATSLWMVFCAGQPRSCQLASMQQAGSCPYCSVSLGKVSRIKPQTWHVWPTYHHGRRLNAACSSKGRCRRQCSRCKTIPEHRADCHNTTGHVHGQLCCAATSSDGIGRRMCMSLLACVGLARYVSIVCVTH